MVAFHKLFMEDADCWLISDDDTHITESAQVGNSTWAKFLYRFEYDLNTYVLGRT